MGRASSSAIAAVLIVTGLGLGWAGFRVTALAWDWGRSPAAAVAEDGPTPDVSPWIVRFREDVTSPGLRPTAAKTVVNLNRIGEPDNRAAMRAAVQDLLAVHPTEAGYWPYLAELQSATLASRDEQLQSIRLSNLVERFESNPMFQRVSFAVWHWGMLPDELRDDALNDLLALRPRLSQQRVETLRSSVGEMPPEAQADLRQRLAARLPDEQWLGRIGL